MRYNKYSYYYYNLYIDVYLCIHDPIYIYIYIYIYIAIFVLTPYISCITINDRLDASISNVYIESTCHTIPNHIHRLHHSVYLKSPSVSYYKTKKLNHCMTIITT